MEHQRIKPQDTSIPQTHFTSIPPTHPQHPVRQVNLSLEAVPLAHPRLSQA